MPFVLIVLRLYIVGRSGLQDVRLATHADQVGQPFPCHGLAVTVGTAILTIGVGGGVV